MLKYCQGLNSKCFLLAYLIAVGFLLTFWFNKVGLDYTESRIIPDNLKPYLTSPPRPIDIDVGAHNDKLALTSLVSKSQWQLVYFTHSNCFPFCDQTLRKLSQFQSAFEASDVITAIIDIDTEAGSQDQLSIELARRGYDFTVYDDNNEQVIDTLTRQVGALFLRTDFDDGQYKIEQKHDVFLIDPKNRVYAMFDENTSFKTIQHSFVMMRQFYAKTE